MARPGRPEKARRAAALWLAAAFWLAGCAAPPGDRPGTTAGAAETRPEPPRLGWFSSLRVPDGHDPILRLTARGVQIFRCERADRGYAWRFRQAEAELLDAGGAAVGRHGAGFSFEHRDGSRLLGTVVAHEAAATAGDLPQLLLSARGWGKGALAGVSYVQRVDTRGGMPPPACDAGQLDRLLRVDFSAGFVFYRPRG